MMVHRIIAFLAVLCLAQGQAAHAASPVQLKCHIKMRVSGERMTHIVTVDLDHHSVQDGTMHFVDGGPSVPLTVDNLRAFVRKNGPLVQWGIEYRATGEPDSLFTIDMNQGSYDYSDADGTNSKGTCNHVGSVS